MTIDEAVKLEGEQLSAAVAELVPAICLLAPHADSATARRALETACHGDGRYVVTVSYHDGQYWGEVWASGRPWYKPAKSIGLGEGSAETLWCRAALVIAIKRKEGG